MNTTGRIGTTLIELLVVAMVIGASVPAFLGALNRQVVSRSRGIAHEQAIILAREGTELLMAGGFYHWWGLVRPILPPLPPSALYPSGTYSYNPSGPFPLALNADVTLTVHATGNVLTDDPFNPYIGSKTATIPPWSLFRRDYILRSRHRTSRVLECFVEVWHEPGDASDRLSIPIILTDHPDPSSWRGLVWLPLATQLRDLDGLMPYPNLPPPGRAQWGKPVGPAARRPFLDSVFPVTTGITPAGYGYPP